jgi:molecular chaperone HscC
VTITRAAFGQAVAPLLARLHPVLRRCLRDAGMEATRLDDVLMVGGASRMPGVIAQVAEDIGRTGNRTIDPDRVVALGAAVQAALIDGDAAVADLVLTDVAPHTLGVEIAKEIVPGRPEAGCFPPLIDRNTTVPVSRSEPYNTLHPGQDQIALKLYQGEGRRTSDNTLPGTLTVDDLRQRPGQKHPGVIEVRLTYDTNGILDVDVTILSCGARKNLVIESGRGRCRGAAFSWDRGQGQAPRVARPGRVRQTG